MGFPVFRFQQNESSYSEDLSDDDFHETSFFHVVNGGYSLNIPISDQSSQEQQDPSFPSISSSTISSRVADFEELESSQTIPMNCLGTWISLETFTNEPKFTW